VDSLTYYYLDQISGQRLRKGLVMPNDLYDKKTYSLGSDYWNRLNFFQEIL
jgi:hypothetical protein